MLFRAKLSAAVRLGHDENMTEFLQHIWFHGDRSEQDIQLVHPEALCLYCREPLRFNEQEQELFSRLPPVSLIRGSFPLASPPT